MTQCSVIRSNKCLIGAPTLIANLDNYFGFENVIFSSHYWLYNKYISVGKLISRNLISNCLKVECLMGVPCTLAVAEFQV